MQMRLIIRTYVSFVLFLCLASYAGVPQKVQETGARESRVKLALALAQTLQEFSQKHHLDDEEAQRLFGELILASPAISKGSAGLIDNKEGFVLLNESRNTLLLDGKKWEGMSSSESEIVITDGHTVLWS